jgi:uncharacterized membrane protein YdbT with pleckstrin-like domain
LAYYTKVLQPNENVRVVGRLHWLVYSKTILLLIVAIALFFWTMGVQDPEQKKEFLMATGAAFGLMLVMLFAEWIQRRSTEIVVTDHRVIYKTGILSRHTTEMNISKIETVDIDQSILGRIFGYGTILIRGTGETIEPLRSVGAPITIRNAITIG